MSNTLKEKLAAGGCIGCHWATLGSPSVAEVLAESGPDCIVFDMQHGLWDRLGLEYAIGLVRHKTVPAVRSVDASDHAIGMVLDAGARALIVPMVDTADQARAVVRAAKFPPMGGRSGGGTRPMLDAKTYMASANDDIVVAVMIETATAVANAAEIAAVPGIDMLFIGPFDLAMSLGTFPDFGPKHEAAVQSVLGAAKAAGKTCGIFTPYASFAVDRRAQGFQWVVLAYDQSLIQEPAKGAVKHARMGSGPDLVKDAVALVSGANGGIGSEVVRALLRAGAARIYCGARQIDSLRTLTAVAPDRLIPVQLDVADAQSVAQVAKACADVTLLINNAGWNSNEGLFGANSLDNARREMETNYLGTLAVSRAFQPILARNGGGGLVNLITVVAHCNLPLMSTYAASKAALLSLTQGLRAELRNQGTHVMGVLPGAVDTPMTPGFEGMKMRPQQVAEALIQGLLGRVEDIYPGGMASGVFSGISLDAKAIEGEFSNYLPADSTARPKA
ncbi:SDR family oxidoreductase [Dongia sp.]|uniref:SDR family oxidoreductase n=1 Tax=Dongia sp. TaxID=1977262 RepID=UPI0035B04BB0